MMDIVEKLRLIAKPTLAADKFESAVLTEAADEIESLRRCLQDGSPVVEGTIQHMAMEIMQLKKELEREHIRLAACGSAALGYFEGCLDEYHSASLDDVLRLHESHAALKKERDELKQNIRDMNEYMHKRIEAALAKLGADKGEK